MTTASRIDLMREHETLEEQMHHLARVADAGDASALVEPWRAFERALAEHLELEERELFPDFAEQNPQEVVALRAEHAVIRGRVEDLGLRVELHTLRADVVHELVAALRDHAAREDRIFYRWVDARKHAA